MCDANLSTDLLPLYYSRLFPLKEFCQWLSYADVVKTNKKLGNSEDQMKHDKVKTTSSSICEIEEVANNKSDHSIKDTTDDFTTPSNYLDRREMSFTLADDVYIRYQSFKNAEEFRRELMKKCPHKIDIGAVYNHRPKERSSVAVFQPQEKELVFDIDMTDYDDVRSCCSGADICEKCWKFMTIAIRCMDDTLRKDFGFQRLLWVYSGRRGVHCWVCDAAARKLSQQARAAVAEYLQLIKGGQNQSKKVTIMGARMRNEGAIVVAQMHPMVRRSVKTCRRYFQTVCLEEQDIFSSVEQHTALLKLIPDDFMRKELAASFRELKTSKDKWEELVLVFRRYRDSGKLKRTSPYLLEEIILQYTYPRLDIEVTKGLNHLLKAPFCVHPKTGRVCVPIDASGADKFNPLTVPTVSELEAELNAAPKKRGSPPTNKSGAKEEESTSLDRFSESLELFKNFLDGLETRK